MTFSEILKFGIAMNIFAGLGAFVFAWVEDWLTSKTTIFISLIGLVGFGSALLFVEAQSYFWAFGLGLSFLSALHSRPAAHFLPDYHQNNFMEKCMGYLQCRGRQQVSLVQCFLVG